MKTQPIIVNRQDIWITVDPIYEEGKIIGYHAYYKFETPGLILGESFKDDLGETIIFSEIAEAENQLTAFLRNKIYPPFFLDPLEYDAENFSELKGKEIIVQKKNSSLRGIVLGAVHTGSDATQLSSLELQINKWESTKISFFDIESFQKP